MSLKPQKCTLQDYRSSFVFSMQLKTYMYHSLVPRHLGTRLTYATVLFGLCLSTSKMILSPGGEPQQHALVI